MLSQVRNPMLISTPNSCTDFVFCSGFSIYYAALGPETPCFSHVSQALLPASITSNGVQLTLITDTVFSRKYTLVSTSVNSLSPGAIAGIVISVIVMTALMALLIWRTRRHKAERLAAQNKSTTFPPDEPALHGPTATNAQMSEVPADNMRTNPKSPQELPSPESAGAGPGTGVGTNPGPSAKSAGLRFPPPDPMSSPPSYVKSTATHEMPGSTYMHEHHPAFTPYGYGGAGAASSAVDGMTLAGGSREVSIQQSPPRTPPRSPGSMSTRSPILSPSSPAPYRSDSPLTGIVSPLGSPGLPAQRSSPRFREGTM